MNSKTKKRMFIVGGVIVIAIILLVAFLGGNSAAKTITVADAAGGSYAGKKVQVTGMVVDNSYNVDNDGVLTFKIKDEKAENDDVTVDVSYDKGVSSTFGNGITAICTGRMEDDGTLTCSELVTKCPSKYENASSALTISQLLGYDTDQMLGKTVKVSGTVKAGSLKDASADVRLVIEDKDGATLNIVFAGALSEKVTDGAAVVVTGALQDDGSFLASGVSLEG